MPARQFPPAVMGRVPQVVGLNEQTAIQTLRSAGFKTDIKIVQSYLPQGQVLTQDPTAGTQTVGGITVHLTVSNGVAKKVTIPSVKGLSLSSAQSLLYAINVTPVVVYWQTSDPSLDGIAIGVTPTRARSSSRDERHAVRLAGPAPSLSPARARNGGGGATGTGTGAPRQQRERERALTAGVSPAAL
jgi:beta-lactam-binding protein with PASTA domain